MRTVVVGASSGVGRCIGIGLAQRGAQVALLARRRARLEKAAAEAGASAVPVTCDVTDEASCAAAIEAAIDALGGLDGLVYAPAIGPLAALVDTDVAMWRAVFDTNVIGAARITAAAVPHLTKSAGKAVYLSSVSASVNPPYEGLGAYAVSKAALDKLVEAWRVEHPDIGFTRLTIGDCAGGTGDSAVEFSAGWDPDLAVKYGTRWVERGYITGAFIDVDELTGVIDALLRSGATLSVPNVVIAPRPSAKEAE